MAYILGVDGGGTKTVALVADTQGRILGQGLGGPSNYHTVGAENAIGAIREAAQRAVEHARLKSPQIHVAVLGLAGAGRPGDAMFMQVSLELARLAADIYVTHDADIALAGAMACGPGVVVIAGTGAIAFGMSAAGKIQRVDGWGHIIGDAGSAYDIARRALIAAFRAHDGRGPSTMLTNLLVKYFQTRSMEDIVGVIYTHREKKQHIASAAPLVFEAADKGDSVSLGILRRAGQELGLSAWTVIRGLGMADEPVNVACVGGIFRTPHPALQEAFRYTVTAAAPKATIAPPRFPSAVGAVLLSLKRMGKLMPRTLRAVATSSAKLRPQEHE